MLKYFLKKVRILKVAAHFHRHHGYLIRGSQLILTYLGVFSSHFNGPIEQVDDPMLVEILASCKCTDHQIYFVERITISFEDFIGYEFNDFERYTVCLPSQKL